MPDQLLWSCLETAEREKCELEVPSWSWASTRSSVRYLEQFGAKNACQRITLFASSQTLIIKSQIRQIKRMLPYSHLDSHSAFLVAARPYPPHMTPTEMMFFPTDDEMERGSSWCVLDEGKVPEGAVWCLRLMSSVVKNPRQGVKKMVKEWVLILTKVEQPEGYVRVGVGSIERQDKSWFGGVTVSDIVLQ